MKFTIFVFIFCCAIIFPFTAAHGQLQMPIGNNEGLEIEVRNYFSDVPVMIAIAKCESGFRQFNNAGLPLMGGFGTNVGIFQINEASHASTALNLGYDIYSVQGNMGYAKYLYTQQGIKPWVSCAASTPKVTDAPVVPAPIANIDSSSGPTLTLNMRFGMTDAQVVILQRRLNASGFKVADSGPGSPGNETSRFGQLTKQAVQRFQCSKGIVCEGDEFTTGYGTVGPRTRQALNAVQL